MHFFDTYALWEGFKKNPDYEQYFKGKLVCTIFNIYEFYWTLLKAFGKETAVKHTLALEDCAIEVSVQNIVDAFDLKKQLNTLDVSFIDCLGYVKAQEIGIRFLTGDKAFKDMENVEFVK